MGIEVGRAYRLEYGSALAAAMSVTGISKATQAVVSGTGFTVTAGQFVFLGAVDGMTELNNVVARVATSPTPSATAFTLEGIDSTSFGDWVASPGVRAVTTWTTIAQITGVDFGAGSVDSIDITTVLDTARQNAAGLISRPDITVNLFSDYATGAAQTAMDVAANAGTILPFRATRASGYRRCFAGIPSEVGESVSVNQAITGSFTIINRSNRYVRYLT
jgi:hypothetical protein